MYTTISYIHLLSCRLLADPAFLYRFVLEEVATVGCSLWWELKNRKDRCVMHLKPFGSLSGILDDELE